MSVLIVTDGTLQALGVRPLHGRWFTSQEYGPSAEGPAPVNIAALVVILSAAALASYLPARRAATIDPMQMLRAE